jgi:cytochrome c553
MIKQGCSDRETRHWKGNRHRALCMLVPMLLTAMTTTAVADPSAENGKAISGECAACHGNDGTAVNTSYPNLAGQNYQYLVDQLERFKGGERHSSIMHSMVLDLSDQQIQDLAAYYSSIRRNCSP